MKKFIRIISIICVVALTAAFAGCTPFDEQYGKSDVAVKTETESTSSVKSSVIMSDDTVMPKYFDISLYDEENYADIYLGKKYQLKITYSGSELELPTTYKVMKNKGWTLMESGEYSEDSAILAGKSVETQLINEYNKQITAVFYNSSKSSVSLKRCPIVKFIVRENILDNPESVYGQFWVNGVSNESVITDIIDYLGAPSHFYAVTPSEYYLDYFMYAKDRRNGITVYVDTEDDGVHSIEVACYE